jgi:polyvinyl alcohol dehydrogenase (cytochrome)
VIFSVIARSDLTRFKKSAFWQVRVPETGRAILRIFKIIVVVGFMAVLKFGLAANAFAQAPANQTGADLYDKNCSTCHDNTGATNAPPPSALRNISPEAVLQALEPGGLMQDHGKVLNATQKRLLARYLTGKEFGAELPAAAKSAFCKDSGNDLTDPFAGPHWIGWGVDPENSRYQRAEQAKMSAADMPNLKLKWAFAFPGAPSAYTQPTVAGGRIFVSAANRAVYSLDAETACIHWTFQPSSNVRTAIELARPTANGPLLAFFGDRQGNVYALDANSGKVAWQQSVEVDSTNHVFLITGALKIHEGLVFVPVTANGEVGMAPNPKYECCKFSGAVVAYDAATGKRIWRAEMNPEPVVQRGVNRAGTPIWGPSGTDIWNSPTLDLKLKVIYVGTGENHSVPTTSTSDGVMALDMKTGKILWTHQLMVGDAWNGACDNQDHANCPAPSGPDYDFGSSVILVALPNGKRALIAGQKSGMVFALDPDNKGALLWQARVARGGTLGGVEWGMASDGKVVYVPVSDKDEKDHAPGAPPGMRDIDYTKGGGLFALDIATGKKVWNAPPILCAPDRGLCTPSQLAAATVIPGVVFSGSEDGHMRGYSTKDGEVIWDYDTEREYDTLNGKGNGGSINGPGPVVVDGVVYFNSGYSREISTPGNVLLAFSAH